jgi:hypothetical protein
MARLELPRGQWLDVKDDVRAKDKRDSYEYSGLKAGSDGSRNQDIAALQRHQAGSAAIWISSWSIIADGKAAHWPGDRATFKNRVDAVWDLPGRTFDMVVTAVQNYMNAIDNEEVAEKNEIPAGATT